jgi:hypothetical protein
MSTYQLFVASAIAATSVGVALAVVASRWPRARVVRTPAFLLVATGGLALVLLLAGPIAFTLLGWFG